MTDISFADLEYQIKHLPANKIPLVYQFIRSLSESSEDTDSSPGDQHWDYDFMKTRLWEMRGSIRTVEQEKEDIQTPGRKKTNFADSVDEVVYGVSLSRIEKNDKEDSR